MAREAQAVKAVGVVTMGYDPVRNGDVIHWVGGSDTKALTRTVRHIEGSLRNSERLHKDQQGIVIIDVEVEAEGGVQRHIDLAPDELGSTPIHEEDFGGLGAGHRI